MWQRIQTIFLFLSGSLMIASNFFPLWLKAHPEDGRFYEVRTLYLQYIEQAGGEAQITYFPYFFLAILSVISAIVSFYEISQFKNRLTQMKMGALNSLVMAGFLGLTVYFSIKGQKIWLPSHVGNFTNGIFFPVSAMLFNVLANRFIRRDHKLVKSVDRLR